MPDLLDDLRRLGGPDRAPSDEARRLTLRRLQREIDDELGATVNARRPRLRPRVIVGAAAAIAIVAAAASALVPTAGPGAQEILERAAAAIGGAERPEIVVADIRAEQLQGSTVVASYGTRRIWARQVPGRGTQEFRSLQLTDATGSHAKEGDEMVSFPSPSSAPAGMLPFTSAHYSAADNQITVSRGAQGNIGPALFQARALLAKARRGDEVTLDEDATVNGRPAYKVTWIEDTSRAPNKITVKLTLWIDRSTYAPLLFTDHGYGTDAQGRPLDQTYKATVLNFDRLPDTATNRELLEMRPHPGAQRVTRDAGQRP